VEDHIDSEENVAEPNREQAESVAAQGESAGGSKEADGERNVVKQKEEEEEGDAGPDVPECGKRLRQREKPERE
jgi:hypothetical protein